MIPTWTVWIIIMGVLGLIFTLWFTLWWNKLPYDYPVYEHEICIDDDTQASNEALVDDLIENNYTDFIEHEQEIIEWKRNCTNFALNRICKKHWMSLVISKLNTNSLYTIKIRREKSNGMAETELLQYKFSYIKERYKKLNDSKVMYYNKMN